MSSKVYGKSSDGALSVCKARPENRGSGKCNHADHVEFDSQEAEKLAAAHNEKIFEKEYGTFPDNIRNNLYPTNFSENRIQSNSKSKALTKEQLLESASKVAENFDREDWKVIQDFYKNFDRRIADSSIQKRFENSTKNIETFLRSSNGIAVQVREFLGDQVNLSEFSHILTHQVKAMTVSERWRVGRRVGLKRILFTSLDNDMNRERYVASVMFFGGRCCYCNRVLRKNPPPENQASGEHITPVSPENPETVHGGTRFGNMALACVSCNNSRQNKDLVTWVQETNCIKQEDKPHVLGRIQAFRKFALYHEYDKEENDRILAKSEELAEFVDSLRNPDGTLPETADDKIVEKIKVALYDLKHGDGENQE